MNENKGIKGFPLDESRSKDVQEIYDLRQQTKDTLVLTKVNGEKQPRIPTLTDSRADNHGVIVQWNLEHLTTMIDLATSLEVIFDKGEQHMTMLLDGSKSVISDQETKFKSLSGATVLNEIADCYCKIALVNICQWILSTDPSSLAEHSDQLFAPSHDDKTSLDISVASEDEMQPYLLSLAWSILKYFPKRQIKQQQEKQNQVEMPEVSCIIIDNNDDLDDDDDNYSEASVLLDELADSCLDWAIASKRAGQLTQCVIAHKIRMALDPSYQVTDAVRLLGLPKEESSALLSSLQTEQDQSSTLLLLHQEEGKDNKLYFFINPLFHMCMDDGNAITKIQEMQEKGIFEANIVSLSNPKSLAQEENTDTIHNQCDTPINTAAFKYQPTQHGTNLGRNVRSIFAKYDYNLKNCRALLVPLISNTDDDHEEEELKVENATHPARIFSANSFFQHRHEFAIYVQEKEPNIVGSTTSPDPIISGIEALAGLFLFGIALDMITVERAIGSAALHTLVESSVLTETTLFDFEMDCYPRRVIGTVQVFPISPTDDLHGTSVPSVPAKDCLIFVTDWPMESLRLTRNAVMPVGEDTLELLALTAGAGGGGSKSTMSRENNNDLQTRLSHLATAVQPKTKTAPSTPSRILDLCCGCGIQGIFTAWCCYGNYDKLVCSDVNERACYFAIANITLNYSGIQGISANYDDPAPVSVVCGDLYDGVFKMLESTINNSKKESIDGESTTACYEPFGYFDRIVSNPPFVAVPCRHSNTTPHVSPALYAIGGGADGMDILRRIVRDCPKVLRKKKSPKSMMLMVTEIPNIESSCTLLQNYLPESNQRDGSMTIRIAYVGRDVENVEEYASARENEVNNKIDPTSAPPKDWASVQHQVGVHNRALALISICCCSDGNTDSKDNSNQRSPFQYGEMAENDCDEREEIEEEEDLFLTEDGIKFARQSCLS